VISVRVVDLTVKRFKNNVFEPNTRTFFWDISNLVFTDTFAGFVGSAGAAAPGSRHFLSNLEFCGGMIDNRAVLLNRYFAW
jgi:hypothetical protein